MRAAAVGVMVGHPGERLVSPQLHGLHARCTADTAPSTVHTCLCLHAEENALLGVGRERTEGATLYCNTYVYGGAHAGGVADRGRCPCTPCAVKIIQAGITEVVYSKSYALDIATELVFTQAGVKLRQYLPRP